MSQEKWIKSITFITTLEDGYEYKITIPITKRVLKDLDYDIRDILQSVFNIGRETTIEGLKSLLKRKYGVGKIYEKINLPKNWGGAKKSS